MTRSAPGAKAGAAHFRPDIQGLRAVAVVLVILDHLLAWPSGGFIGVDVFFVISGFLITGLLLREYERTGTISFVGFYRRRARRILPAAVLVLAVTVGGAYVVFSTDRFMRTVIDAAWGLLLASNWRFIATGTDYFTQDGPLSPLQHFWSLAVEEQFYFAWPWLMLLIFTMLGRRARHIVVRRVVLATVVTIAVGSYLWATHASASEPASAYFSTFTRAWELGIGAVLAVTAEAFTRVPTTVRIALSYLGLATIVAGSFLITTALPFPAPWAAIPVAGASLVIVVGTGTTPKGLWPLTTPVTRWLGDLSYSLYLWHFPVIVLLAALLPPGPVYYCTVAATVLLLATGGYYLVERPIHRGAAASISPIQRKLRVRVAAMSALAVVAAATTTAAAIHAQSLQVTSAGSQAVAAPQGTDAGDRLMGLPAQISAALKSSTWPRLTPSLDSVIAARQVPSDTLSCGLGHSDIQHCTWGSTSATKRIVLVGDSTSLAYVATFRRLVQLDRHYSVTSLGSFGCPFLDVVTAAPSAGSRAACEARKNDAVHEIAAIKPQLVVVTNEYTGAKAADGTTVLDGSAWQSASQGMLTRIASDATRIVVLPPPPSTKDVRDCYTRFSQPRDCVSTVTALWSSLLRADSQAVAAVHGTLVDPSAWFCVDKLCPAFVGTRPVKLDLNHVTSAYAAYIAPDVLTEFRSERLVE